MENMYHMVQQMVSNMEAREANLHQQREDYHAHLQEVQALNRQMQECIYLDVGMRVQLP